MKKIISILMTIVLCTGLVSFSPVRDGKTGSAVLPVQADDTVVAELEAERTASSKTYLLADGSNRYVAYAYDIHYLGDDGKYYDIDTSLVSAKRDGFLYTNAANSWTVYFAEDKLELANGENKITLSLPKAESVLLARDAKKNDSEYLEQIQDNNNAIVYSYEGFSIVYSVLTGALKEDIVIDREDALQDFTFGLEFSKGLTLQDKDGLKLVDAEGNPVFEFADLFMYDANGKQSNAVGLEYKINGSEITLTVKPDKEFFNDETAYPVVIDPSITVTGSSITYDTCVDEQYPTSNYYLSQNLWTGGASGANRMRTFIKFTLPTTITASQITRATINIKKNAYENPTIRAYRVTSSWSSGSVTWNAQPSFATTASSNTFADTNGDGWYDTEVTDLVYAFMAGTYSNYGFVLKEPAENSAAQKTRFYSSDAAAANAPTLVINYVNYIGSRSYQQVNSTTINCMGYALEFNQFINGDDLDIDINALVGKNKEEILDYISYRAEIWMDGNLGIGNYYAIGNYESSIYSSSPGWFRVVLRVGFEDDNHNGVYDYSENIDYHWWYQTNENYGVWADKLGGFASGKKLGTNGLNPAAELWYNPYINVYYNSGAKVYQIKDSRSL